MFTRRIVPATLGAVLILIAGAAPAAAAGPTRASPAERASIAAERPLTRSEQAASNRKVAAAMVYLASPAAMAMGRATLGCATPEGATPKDVTSSRGLDAIAGAGTLADCDIPSGFLGVSARDQTRAHYCGPAVGQVIANYTWAVPLDANKYSQAKIAGWMQTDANGGTSAFTMEDGLEIATASAPRRPPDWDWVVTYLKDADRDGGVGDQLHDYVRSNVSGSRMALAIPVLPHQRDARFHLSSWPNPVRSPGHWIAAYGWKGLYDGTDFSRLYYTDSSKDEGGSTGRFWDPVRHVAGMIMDHTERFVW
jgi:hypothetical protein